MTPTRGWWNMACWNGLSAEQQQRLIAHGNLPIDYTPDGTCPHPAEVAIETQWDVAPGPRFYCRECAIVAVFTLPTHAPVDVPDVPDLPTR